MSLALVEIANTVHTNTGSGNNMDQFVFYPVQLNIRRFTPREALRLMDVDDESIDLIQSAGISNTQQRKLAGNSIAVSCLYHIFRKMFVDAELCNQLK